MGLLNYLEPLATVASGVVAEPLAGWYGLLGGGGSGVEDARNALTYMPRTEGGKKTLQQLGGLLGDAKRVMVDENPPVRMVVNGYGAATDYVADRSPVAGAALATVPAAAGMFLGNAGAPARAAFGSAGRAATDLGMRTAMAAERGLVPIVNQTMQRGGLPAQLLRDMSRGTKSNMIDFPISMSRPEKVDAIRKMAEDFSQRAENLGLSSSVEHSGSAMGPSSYVSVSDPITGSRFPNQFRFSDHSKGPYNSQYVYDAHGNFDAPIDQKFIAAIEEMASKIPKDERDAIRGALILNNKRSAYLAEKEKPFTAARDQVRKATQEAIGADAQFSKAFSNSGKYLYQQSE